MRIRPAPPFAPLAPLALLALLAACQVKVDKTAAQGSGDGNVHVAMDDSGGGANHVSIDVPGFAAKVTLPGLNLGDHLQLDDIKLAPGTSVKTVDVNATDGAAKDGAKDEDDRGRVHIAFTSPQPPAALADYYRKALTDAGYTIGAVSDGALTATKADKAFALAATPAGTGSSGRIMLNDGK